MKTPLAAGDRVRVYGNTQIGSFDKAPAKGKSGVVSYDYKDGWVDVKFDEEERGHSRFTVHSKQCRRLKPKPKPKPQPQPQEFRVWKFDGSAMIYECYENALKDAKDYGWRPLREFVYLRPGKVVVDRAALAAAWNTAFASNTNVGNALAGGFWKDFCKALEIP